MFTVRQSHLETKDAADSPQAVVQSALSCNKMRFDVVEFPPDSEGLTADPLWYKNGIIYQIHVRAFFDSNGDGIGDFKGLTQKLDYIRDLGVTTIWLLPFYPSPLRDDGYDIADYTRVNPIYGTLSDFTEFLAEAHKRGLRVITELVLNHTSDQHEWFQKSRRAPAGSYWRDFYVWSDTPDKYQDARIIFKDFEPSNWSYDPVAKSYFWHRFYSHQPDLNFENPHVQEALLKAMEFWLDLGVDGLRLDAVPYLFEREGTNCENLPETHDFLRKLRTHVDAHYQNRMLLAEANQWPEDAIAYFGKGDECHMAFHFPLMPRMYMALAMEDRFPIIDILEQTPAIPETCQWAVFLRNHDELTLEMVTDEERDYMYRIYAHETRARINLGIRRRLAPLMSNDRRKIELLNGLLFTLPGTPVVYYGDELGMGDNIYLGDRNGVRTPIQWSPDRNAGFSTANPQSLYLPVVIDPEYHYEALNVEGQQANPNSLLWWMKRMISLRKQHEALLRGDLRFLNPENRKVLSFTRQLGDDIILFVANLSRLAQFVELPLSEFQGLTPTELFGQTVFPVIGTTPYTITLTAYSFYMFKLERAEAEQKIPTEDSLPQITLRNNWTSLFHSHDKTPVEATLKSYLRRSHWFKGKGRRIKSIHIREVMPLQYGNTHFVWTLITLDYTEGEGESYSLPFGWVPPESVETFMAEHPKLAVARLTTTNGSSAGLLADASDNPDYNRMMLDMICESDQSLRHLPLTLDRSPDLQTRIELHHEIAHPALIKGEHSNTTVNFGNEFFLKQFRKLDEGLNPDVEISRFLAQKADFKLTPRYLGSLSLETRGSVRTLATLQSYVPHQEDAWAYTVDFLGTFFETILSRTGQTVGAIDLPEILQQGLIERLELPLPQLAQETMGIFLQNVEQLGQLTAQMHKALTASKEDPDFSPELFSSFNRRSFYQSIRTLTDNTLMVLQKQLPRLSAEDQQMASTVLEQEARIYEKFHRFMDQQVPARRIRVHGHFDLGQILYTGKDFMVVDFEGEPARSIGQRRLKASPLRDVAGILRSFQYAAATALNDRVVREEDRRNLIPWSRFWYSWASASYMKSYLAEMNGTELLPEDRSHLQLLLDLHLLEKALYELSHELNNRPAWVRVPLRGLLRLLEEKI